MDIQPRRPQGDTPNRAGRPSPNRPRPFMNDFAPRRPLVAAPQPPRPVPPTTTPLNVPQPSTPAPTPIEPSDALFERPTPSKLQGEAKTPKRHSTTGHAGLVGLLIFTVLAAVLLSGLLPGKVIENFPGSSASSSAGDQTLACANDPQNVSSTTHYTTKLGAPLTYKTATTTTLRGTCDGKSQTVTGGTTSQFSPIAALVNIALAAVVAFIVTAIWRKIFGTRD